MGTFSAYSSNVLTIRNFPLLFNENDREEFLQHFGAVRVRCLTRYKNFSNLILADFGSPSQTSQALHRLHQLEILARRLVVEYSSLGLAHFAFSGYSSSYEDDENALLHAISPGIHQIRYSLPSERLSYDYPPIDDHILANINRALLSIPSFYTQVLHLMNKMSLPCPMATNLTASQRTLSTTSIACQTDRSRFSEVVDMDTDEDESEIDDGEEEQRVKRHHRSLLSIPIRQGIIPTSQTDLSKDSETKKKSTIELKIPSKLHQQQTESSISIQGFGRLEPTPPTIVIVPQEKEPPPPLPLISLEEIVKNRLNEEQLRQFDNGRLYRNYERGHLSQRLYIKNIETKHVDERILHSLYDRYQSDSSPIDIRLLREGKMKGQAFVTFPNEGLALNALNDTNGYILYEKPIVVQFARTAKPKDILC